MPGVPSQTAELQWLRVLLAEDSPVDARLIQESLRQSSWGTRLTLRHVTTLAATQAALKEENFDCILLDLGLPDAQGVQSVTLLREQAPGTAIVVMTGLDDEDTAVAALKAGAQEYTVKGLPAGELLLRLMRHAIERHQHLIELNKLREQEYFQVTHDPLTGLPNRQLFADRAQLMTEQARRQHQQLAVCYLDLDGFKPVNDIYGHAVGDLLLKAVTTELRQAVRSGDTVARLGGDEFAVLLTPSASGRLEAQQIAQRLIDRVQAITSAGGNPVRIGVSIGIAIMPDHADDLEQLLQRADLAMYAAKSSGRGRYRFYSVEMLGEREHKNRVVAEIGEGLRLQRFFLHWQPWFDVQQRSVMGIEVLPRWRTQSGDIRLLRQYAALAEGSGLMPKILRQVLPAACRQWSQWRQQGLSCGTLALEIGLRGLRDSQVVNDLGRILLEQNVAPENFQINLPGDNDSLLHSSQLLIQRVRELRGIGFRVMLDRLAGEGPGLRLLSQLPVNAVRAESELVNRLDGPLREDALARIARIIDTAASFGMEALMPEVESREQMQLLRQLGCRYMQGFLLARPGDERYTEHMLQELVKV